MRGQVRMTWVKFHIAGWLHGSIRWQLDPAERGVWADIIVLAGERLMGGKICDNDGKAFPFDFIASQLHIPLDLFEQTIAKCQKEGRIKVKEGVIIVTNWTAYQSEYERQKQYRQKPGQDEDSGTHVKGKYSAVVEHDMAARKERK